MMNIEKMYTYDMFLYILNLSQSKLGKGDKNDVGKKSCAENICSNSLSFLSH